MYFRRFLDNIWVDYLKVGDILDDYSNDLDDFVDNIYAYISLKKV